MIMTSQLLLLACLVVLFTYSNYGAQGQTKCTNGFPPSISRSNSVPKTLAEFNTTRIIPGMRFTCSGTLVSWTVVGRINSNSNGEYPRLKVFQEISGEYKFIDEIELGKCGLEVAEHNGEGYYTCEIPKGTRTISVQSNDIFGIYLPIQSLSAFDVYFTTMTTDQLNHVYTMDVLSTVSISMGVTTHNTPQINVGIAVTSTSITTLLPPQSLTSTSITTMLPPTSLPPISITTMLPPTSLPSTSVTTMLPPTSLPSTSITTMLPPTSSPSTSITTMLPPTSSPSTSMPLPPPTISLPLSCSHEELLHGEITYIWLETLSGGNASFICPNNPEVSVKRECGAGGQWGDFDQQGCALITEQLSALNMASENLTNETLGLTVETLSKLVGQSQDIPEEQSLTNLEVIASTLSNVADFITESDAYVIVNEAIAEYVIQTLSSLQQWTPTAIATNSSSQIVESFEVLAVQYVQQLPPNTQVSYVTPSMTVIGENTAVEILQQSGRNLSLTINSDGTSDGQAVSDQQAAAIHLPNSLFKQISDRTNVGVFFALYDTAILFPVYDISGVNSTTKQSQIGSRVLAATVGTDMSFENLVEPVTVMLSLEVEGIAVDLGSETCVSWDFYLQAWTPRGCITTVSQNRVVNCTCNHLTNFAVLVDICLRQDNCQHSRVNPFLTTVSYIGIPISIVCLIMTVIILLSFKKLRQKDISKYHIQLSFAMLYMYVASLVLVILSAERVAAIYGGCLTVSVLVHYFVLAAVMWMGAEAVLMFQKVVIVFVHISHKYIAIVSVICWSVPIIPVIVPLIVDLVDGRDVGGDIIIRRGETFSFCFLSHPGAFWGAFLAPVITIMVFNVVVFVCIIVVLIRHAKNPASLRKNTDKTVIHLMLSISGVMFIFGLTWLFAILTVSVPGLRETFQILFTVFSSLQGIFIFLFTSVINSEARNEWKNAVFACRRLSPQPTEAKWLSKPAASKNTNFINPRSGITNAIVLQGTTTYCDQEVDQSKMTVMEQSKT